MGTSTHDLWGVGIGLGARLARAAERFEILGFVEPLRQRDRARELVPPFKVSVPHENEVSLTFSEEN